MGVTISSLFSRLFGKTEFRIVMLGIDDVGKTTILYKLKLGKIVTTIPSIGFNAEVLEYKNISFAIWDVASLGMRHEFWRHFIKDAHGLIFVVVSNNRDEYLISTAGDELHKMLEDENLKDAVILIFANKQDLSNAMNVAELTDKLRLNQIRQRWHIQAASAIQGHGLYEGLDWLSSELTKKL